MNSHVSFVEACLAGDVDLDQIDDYVDLWHDGPSELELSDFLGMTWDEYARWVETPQVLPQIILAHRFGLPLREPVDKLALAARGANAREAALLEEWLATQAPTPA